MSSSTSLAGRAIIAVLLMIGFYLLALAIAGALIWIPWAEWQYAGRLHVKILIGCVVAALAILWSILPRIDRFEPPGPRLEPADQETLFSLIEEVSRKTEVGMPEEVYLVPEVNAWVAQRGGIMGFGSRRVMGIGLPLLAGTTPEQLKGILAHELGHYHGGDTMLGPWIYKTRGAIGRTLYNLSEHGILQKPFVWYGNFFLRVTQAISRAQELAADQLAVRISSAAALAGGLMAVHRLAPAYDAYWSNEIVPVLGAGYRPPIGAGFNSFVQSGNVSVALNDLIARELEEGASNPYDSHPPLVERLRALGVAPDSVFETSEAPALRLVADLPHLEIELLEWLSGNRDMVTQLRPIDWDQTATSVWVPEWRATRARNRDALAELTAWSLPSLVGSITPLVRKLDLGEIPNEHRVDAACRILGHALAVMLHDDGWTFRAEPGDDLLFTKDGQTIDPFAVMPRLLDGSLKIWEWEELCRQSGISDRPLIPPNRPMPRIPIRETHNQAGTAGTEAQSYQIEVGDGLILDAVEHRFVVPGNVPKGVSSPNAVHLICDDGIFLAEWPSGATEVTFDATTARDMRTGRLFPGISADKEYVIGVGYQSADDGTANFYPFWSSILRGPRPEL